MEDDIKKLRLDISATTNQIFLNFQSKAKETKQETIEMRTYSNGWRPENSWQPMIGSSENSKFKLRG